jgi:glycerol-3-phosphate dehydrogenase
MKNNDQKITETVKKIATKKGFPDIEISATEGIVHLGGQVNSWNEVIEVGHAVGELKEVQEVVNDITAKEIEGKKQEGKREWERLTKPKFYNPRLPGRADVVIIGGGVIGCFIARELSRYKLDIALLEKELDIGCGASKANNAQVHTGIAEHSGTLKKELCARGWPKFTAISRELDVPYKKNGLLVLLTKDTLSRKIPSFIANFILKYVFPLIIVRKGKEVGDKPRVIKGDELFKVEPNLTDRALVGILLPNYGVTCPFRITIAAAENAIQNGVKVLLDTEATDIQIEDGRVKSVVTTRGKIETPFVINAAGLFADEVAEMVGARDFTIHPRKGTTLLFDKGMEGYVNHQVSEQRFPRNPYTKGGAVMITVDGNINWGPTAVEVPDKEDKSITGEEIAEMFDEYGSTFPNFPKKSVITYFAGVRAATYKEDFFIKASRKVHGFVSVAGIQSPGLAAAPAIAEMTINILKETGLKLEQKEDFNPIRKAPPVFDKLSTENKRSFIAKNPLYGHVICRCEHVTEGEIVDAIHSLVPALTIDAIKRRTRAGMGRCQSGFCGPRVASILARELVIPLEEVTKSGAGSSLFIGKTKSLLEEKVNA